MVLGILIATITAPGLLGSQEAIRQSQSKEKREEHRARRCNLIVRCTKSSSKSRELDGRPIVLRNGRLWIDTGTADGSPLGHAYAGYYLPYPDTKYEGLVTTITDVAPIMNWVYIEKETHIVRYGVRADAQPNLTGPFDCTRQDRRLTFDGWEGWCAVEEVPGLWALYFDFDDDGLKSKVEAGTRVLEIELLRKEKRFRKDGEERMRDQTTKRAVDVKEDEPVDKPLGEEAVTQRPGVDGVPEISNQEDEGKEEETAKPKPFMIPKSIFDDPPPMLESSIFQRPDTPPPAYSTTPPPRTPEVAKTTAIDDSLVNPADPPSNSPSALLKPSPVREKPATLVRKRSSGTKALAQAQMFEAMAAAQASKARPSRSSQRSSRASSNADSASIYSVDGLEPVPIQIQAVTSAPVPVSLLKRTASADNKIKKQPDNPTRNVAGKSVTQSQPEPTLPLRQRPRPPSKEYKDPAVFGDTSSKTSKPPPARRPTVKRNSPTPPLSRSRTSAKASSQSPRPLQRQMTAPPPLSTRNASTRSRSTSVSSSGTVKNSLAATMSTGKGNQGMRNRVGSEPGRGRGSVRLTPARSEASRERLKADGRKTTSTLIREIDELVGLEGK